MKRINTMASASVLSLALYGGLVCGALAQAFPDKPVRIVIPYPPGGTTDLVARLAQNRLAALLAQPIIVDNRAGATGAIGAEFVARSNPDGYTIMYTPGTDMVLRQYIMKANPVDAVKDFTPIIATIQSVDVMAAGPALPAATAKEFVDYAKRNPGKLTYGTPGVASHFHLAGELLKIHGVDIVHVPFKGGGPAVAAAAAGQTNLVLGNLTTMHAMVRDGRLKALAVVDAKRNAQLPNVPAMNEILPGYEMPASWFAFFGPARLPAAIVTRLNGDIAQAFQAPELRAKVQELSMNIITGRPEDVTAFLRKTIDTYAAVVKAAGIRPE